MDWTTYERRAALVAQQEHDPDVADYCLDCALRGAESGRGASYEHDGLWLMHRRRDYLRHSRRQDVPLLEATVQASETDDDEPFWNILQRMLQDVCRGATMTRVVQVAILLVEGYKPHEIAQALGVSRMTISRDVGILRSVMC